MSQDINTLVMESFTVSELELNSLSHWNGNLLLCGETALDFEVDKSHSPTGHILIEFDQPIISMQIQESRTGKISHLSTVSVFESMSELKNARKGTFQASGSLTCEHGIDVDFASDLLPGVQYNLSEKTAFPGAPVTLKRVK